MFCKVCGVQQQPEARFCGNCGNQLPLSGDAALETVTMPGVMPEPDEQQRTPYRRVRVELEFQTYQPDEKAASFDAGVLLTSDAISFFEESGQPLSHPLTYRVRWLAEVERLRKSGLNDAEARARIPLPTGDTNYPWEYGSVWVLRQSLNEQFDREFRSDPRAYSKVRGAWWVHGSRNWIWINETPSCDGACVRFPSLMRVQAIAQWAEGRQVPIVYRELTACLWFPDPIVAQKFAGKVEAIIRDPKAVSHAETSKAFSDAYIASIPVNPTTKGLLAYFYVFWTGMAAAIMGGILWGAGVPPRGAILLLIGSCIGVVYCLRRWRQRAAQRGPLTHYVSK